MIRGESSTRLEKTVSFQKDVDHLSTKVTVPIPFSFATKPEFRKSRVVLELEEKRMKEKLAEELECQKKFTAHAVPGFVYTPMYDDIVRQQEERKKMLKEKSAELLQAIVKPFSFTEKELYEEEAQSYRRKQSFQEKKLFKASPFPSKLFKENFEKKLIEKEIARKSASKIRSKVLLESATIPNSFVEHDKLVEKRKNCVKGIMMDFIQSEQNNFRPKINHEVPNFNALHLQTFQQKANSSDKLLVTKCVPFNFESDHRVKKKHKIDRENSSASSTHSLHRKSSFASLLSTSMDSIPTVSTKTSLLRAQKARENIEQNKQMIEETTKKVQLKQIRNKDLQRAIRDRSGAHSPMNMRTGNESVRAGNTEERTRQYLRELNEMKKRVTARPLLFEQVTEKNAKSQAVKKHQQILDHNKVNFDDIQHTSTQAWEEDTGKETNNKPDQCYDSDEQDKHYDSDEQEHSEHDDSNDRNNGSLKSQETLKENRSEQSADDNSNASHRRDKKESRKESSHTSNRSGSSNLDSCSDDDNKNDKRSDDDYSSDSGSLSDNSNRTESKTFSSRPSDHGE